MNSFKKSNTTLKEAIWKELTEESLDNLKTAKIVCAELIFDVLSDLEVKIWVIDNDDYVIFETTKNTDSKLKEQVKNLIAFDLKDNFYSTWDFRNYSRFYFLRDQKWKIEEDQRFIYDNKYMVEIDFSIEHFKEYSEKEIAKVIKQNFPNIGKDDLTNRLEKVKNFYFSSEPACFYDQLKASYIFYKQIDLAKQLIFTIGSFSVSTINLFFSYDHHIDIFDLVVKDLSNDFSIRPRNYKINTGDFITLFESYDDYEKRSDDDAKRNIRLAIGPYEHDNFTLVYNVDVPEQFKMAREFLDVLGEYCSKTNSKSLLKMMAKKKQLLVSEVLKSISFNGEAPYYSLDDDFSNFHNVVTRYMIESGWLTDFPTILLDIQGIDMLRLSIFRYILANWNWIVAIYSYGILENLAESYSAISIKNSAIEEKPLRKEFIRKVLKQELIELENSIEARVSKMTKNTE